MPIAINGTGTITGLSTGGLPDGSVDTDTLADDAVTDAKQSLSGAAKAWINFDGQFATSPFTLANGGIRAAFNVSSVTDNSAGNYTITMTNALASTDYCLVVGGNYYNPGNNPWTIHEDFNHTRTTTTFRIWTNQAGTSFDSEVVCVAVFGD